MALEGWYYLHTNGSLIYKREMGGTAADILESDFARGLWPCDPTDREGAWRILVEASAAGASKERIADLAKQWRCDDADADIYAERIGVEIELDGNAWCAMPPGFTNLQESAAGFGSTKLEALAELCKEIGYRPSKMWGATFADLLKRPDVALRSSLNSGREG